MDIDQLRLFVEVHRRGSFAAVARDRAVDPSSVSRTIAALESELGFGLFDRTTRTLAPTEAGDIYAEHVDDVIGALERAQELAGGHATRPSGTLRVLAPVSFSQLNLVRILPGFLAAYPDLRLDLQLDDAPLDLIEHRIDVAIRLGPLRDSSLIARKIAPMRARVCASPEYLDRRGCPAAPADLAEHDGLVLDMPGFGARWTFRAGDGAIEHVDVPPRVCSSNAVALAQLARDGCGVVLEGEWIVHQDLRLGALVDLFPDHECTASADFDNAMWSLRPARRAHEPAKVRAFLDFLEEGFASAPWNRSRPSRGAQHDHDAGRHGV